MLNTPWITSTTISSWVRCNYVWSTGFKIKTTVLSGATSLVSNGYNISNSASSTMKARQILKRDIKQPRPVLVFFSRALLLMTSKANKLPLETEPVASDNNMILTLKPGDQTWLHLTQLIFVVSKLAECNNTHTQHTYRWICTTLCEQVCIPQYNTFLNLRCCVWLIDSLLSHWQSLFHHWPFSSSRCPTVCTFQRVHLMWPLLSFQSNDISKKTQGLISGLKGSFVTIIMIHVNII